MLDIIFMIQKGYQDLIYEIKKPSCQMQSRDALLKVYTDIEKNDVFFPTQIKIKLNQIMISLPKHEAQEENKFLYLFSFY